MTFVAGVISRLKSRYPIWIDLYRITSQSNNLETGEAVRERTKVKIPKAMVLPPQIQAQVSQALTPLSGGMNHGGFFQVDGTTILIDGKDVPEDFIIDTENCYVIIKQRRYEITKVQEYLLREAFVIAVKAVLGVPLEQIVDRNFNDDLSFTEEMILEP